MGYRVTKRTGLYAAPSVNAQLVTALMTGEFLQFAGEKQADAWIKVVYSPAEGAAVPGWVQSSDCQEVPDVPRPDVKPDGFVRTCLQAEQKFNDLPSIAPWFVAADFVIARAIVETELTNAGPTIAGSDGVGPLQVSTKEWESFLRNAGAFSADFDEAGRDSSTVQVYGATYRMHVDAKAISDLKLNSGTGTQSAPFVPSYLDVFHAYFMDSAEAAVAILDATNSDAGKAKIADVLKDHFTVNQLNALFAARPAFTGTIDPAKSVADFVAVTSGALNGALGKAYDLIKQYAPEVLLHVKQGEAPWFDVACDEEKKGTAEPNPQILKYFDATDYHPQTIENWCGAFVAYCIKNCGSDAAAQSIPKGSAAAANWANWGVGVPVRSADVPQGAVVVLTPSPGTNTTGHVGFFVQFVENGDKVQLLGGNQSKGVQRSEYATTRIMGIRWLDLQPANFKDQFGGTASKSPISDKAFNLIVAFEVTSQAIYEKKYIKPEWPGEVSGVTIGIGYDVGYATRAQLHSDWDGVIDAAMVTALEGAIGVTGPAAKPLADTLRTVVDVSWNAAISVHRTRVIPRWVGVVQHALPNTNAISPDCLGALVSLTYNRGSSYSKQGDRYSEMRNIKACMTNSDFASVPGQIGQMKRLWPHLAGLRDRRDQEAQMFEDGLRVSLAGLHGAGGGV